MASRHRRAPAVRMEEVVEALAGRRLDIPGRFAALRPYRHLDAYTHVLRRGDGQLNRQRPPRLQIVADILLQPPAYSQLVVANWMPLTWTLGTIRSVTLPAWPPGMPAASVSSGHLVARGEGAALVVGGGDRHVA